MQSINWQQEAERALNEIIEQLSEAHRGAFFWYEPMGVVVAFDNRLEDDANPQRQKSLLEEICERRGAIVRAFAIDEQEQSWVMLVTGTEPKNAFDAVWAARQIACSEMAPTEYAPLDIESFLEHGNLPLDLASKYQYEVADKTVKSYFSNPNKWKNCRPGFQS
jgi:hypothetical protein